ncbi:DUF262 domain-containing protein [Candidatus Bipolaricaulota bacterium]|nr:DUF262 domain-containing protein [Candidatus Bipolaricaulota bacterium]
MAKLERTDKPVNVLLDELGKGEVGLPEIQRGYVWNRLQTRDLIDSLYREYPSGLILLWKPEELPELRDGSFEQASERKLDYLVLDGQQRLTSLKQVFDGKIAVYFNVEDESFQIYSAKMKANPLWVSVRDTVGKGAVKVWRELQERIDTGSDSADKLQLDEYLDRLSRLEKIKEYRYPVMIIHTDDYEEVTESFIRINSRGTRLREAELAMAQLALHWPGAIVREFESALEDYEQANYEFEARFLMRCFVAVGTNQSRFRYLSALWKKSQAELETIWKHAKKAVDHTVNFLRNNAGIESSGWIPSINALVPLVVYFSTKEGHLSDKEARGLLFWFLEATIHGRFTGSPETKLDQDLRAIAGMSPLDDLIGNLRRETAGFDITPEMIEGKYQRNPFLPLLFIVFRKNQAQDWFTATVLSSTNVGPDHQLELHHIFPKAVLKQADNYESHEIDDLANIAFLSQKANRTILKSLPNKYLPDIERSRLEAQLVPEQEFWNVEKFRGFLTERRNRLAQAINEYLRELGQDYLL